MTGLLISINLKGDTYNFILVIVNELTKLIHYELVKITISTSSIAEMIFNMVVWYYDLPNLMVLDRSLLLILKFWILLYNFLEIKWQLFTVFYFEINGQTKYQNITIKAYLQDFINFE